MTDAELGVCMGLLGSMASGKSVDDPNKKEAQAQQYSFILLPLDFEPTKLAMLEITTTEDWRPLPSRLRKLLADKLAPCPTASHAFDEVMYKAETIGLWGRPVQHGRFTIYEEGAPPFTHPYIAEAVNRCGGWRMIVNGTAQMQEGIAKQFKAAYEEKAEEGQKRVLNEFKRPLSQRQIPQWHRWQRPELQEPPVMRPQKRLPAPVPPTPPITRALEAVGWKWPRKEKKS